MHKTMPLLLILLTTSLHAADDGRGSAGLRTLLSTPLTEEDSKSRSAIANALVGDLDDDEKENDASKASNPRLPQIKKAQILQDALTQWAQQPDLDATTKHAVTNLKSLPDHNLANRVFECLFGSPKKLKFLAHNMQKLIPAVIVKEDYPVTLQALKQAQKSCSTNPMRQIYTRRSEVSLGPDEWDELHQINPVHLRKGECFSAQSSPSRMVIFKICPSNFTKLLYCPDYQLIFMMSLWDQREQQLKVAPRNQGVDPLNPFAGLIVRALEPAGEITLTTDQQEQFSQLPEDMQKKLTANYSITGPAVPAPGAAAADAAPLVPADPPVVPAAAAAIDADDAPGFDLDVVNE